MTSRKIRWVALAAAVMMAVAGCSTRDSVAPTGLDAGTTLAPDGQERQAIEAALARLSELALTTEFADAPGQGSWQAVEAALAPYGVSVGDARADKRPRYVPVLLVAAFAAEGIGAVNADACFMPLTRFVNDLDDKSLGFSTSWLTPIPNAGDNAYYCSVYVDRPAVWPPVSKLVTPYSEPIYNAAVLQAEALANPAVNVYDWGYYDDEEVLYNYWWSYHSPIGDRVAQVLRFRFAYAPEE